MESVDRAHREHARVIARTLAGWFKRLGSTWSLGKIEELALFVYYIDVGSAHFYDTAGSRTRQAEH